MNIFKNKFFLLGNLAFLLLAIPVVLFIVKNQTSTRGSAAATTTLSFISPSITTDQCDQTKTSRLVLNPGDNIVSTIQLALKWDKTKFDINFAPNTAAFSQTLKGPEQTADGMTITLNIGADVTKAISTTTDVGTITIKPLAPTNGTVISLQIDTAGTKAYSLAQLDGTTENVFNPAGTSPLQISIEPKSCGGTNPSPTTSVAPSTSPTTSVAPSPTIASTNQSPTCIALSSSVSSGAAPLAINFTATGKDTDGTIAKAAFNFGNGAQQDVVAGMGTASASAQLAYTYTSGGTFTATAVFTDNSGAVSAICQKQITVSGAVATLAPTATSTPVPLTPTTPPTATPTIADTGTLTTTVGIIGGVILVIFAGIFLLVL